MTLELTPAQFQVLAGLLDAAIKTLGIRAMEDDVVSLMQAVKAAAQAQPQQMDEAA
jgi:hypothetical protein